MKKIKMEHVYIFLQYLKKCFCKLVLYDIAYLACIGWIYLKAVSEKADYNVINTAISNGVVLWMTVSVVFVILAIQCGIVAINPYYQCKSIIMTNIMAFIIVCLYATLIKTHTVASVNNTSIFLIASIGIIRLIITLLDIYKEKRSVRAWTNSLKNTENIY